MQRKSIFVIVAFVFFLLGLLQGVGFTTIPAAANFICSPAGFAYSAEQYGSLFIPMFAGAILASFLGGSFAKKIGIRSLLVFGQSFNILSMALFATTHLVLRNHPLSFPIFLILMLFLGMGFGATLTSLNAFAFFFFPSRPKTALTALHSCLGIGTAIGPIAFIFFLEHAQWWYDGVLIGSLYFLLLLSVFALFPNPCHITKEKTGKSTLPFSSFALWGFIAIGLLYGICETTFGNWGTIFLHQDKSLSVTSAAIALSLFWGALTFGRILTVIFSFFISTRIIYCTLPPIMFLSIVFLYLASQESWLLSCFALAGLGCSAMLPLTIGFAQERFTTIAPLISGMIIGIYMLGFGLASQGIGLIHKLSHLSYSKLFASLSGPIFVLIALCIGISLGKKKGAKSN